MKGKFNQINIYIYSLIAESNQESESEKYILHFNFIFQEKKTSCSHGYKMLTIPSVKGE